jgi:hypothetical protein
MRKDEDETGLARFVRNPKAIAIHQLITFVMPFVLAVGAGVFNHYTTRLDENTRAIQELRDTVLSSNGTFSQQLRDQEQRITRLENKQDYYGRPAR